jgi:two-component system response regulator HydG
MSRAVRPRVLVVDDESSMRYVLRELLEPLDCDVALAAGGAEALEALRGDTSFDVVLTDLRMADVDGFAVLEAARALEAPPQVVMITAHGSERHAVDALHRGAVDYFRKPFDPDELTAVVTRTLRAARLRTERDRLVDELALAQTMIFAAPVMGELARLVSRVAPLDVNVLITGESGTGKELLAEAIVRGSRRKGGPFIRFNAAALRPELAEAELFGHTKGAFTGAHEARQGLFRGADGGTLLLDEVGDLSLENQARLLRVLQEGEVRPVGRDRPVTVDVRVIAATHQDLEARVAEGAFREDLFYRLKVVHLDVPPLRERPEDIELLAEAFLQRASSRFGVAPVRCDPAMLERLRSYPWPGNVRELQNALEGLVALSRDGVVDLDRLPQSKRPASGGGLEERMSAYERGLIVETLRVCEGNRAEAARRLGIGRATLYEKLAKHAIGRDEV